MKITEVETVRSEEHAEFLGVVLKTDDGVTGLGETCFGPESVEAYIHESVAPRLLGTDPLTIERHAKELPSFYVTHGGTGVSTRAHSAVDIALWDIFGKVCNQPLYQLLGGKVREQAPIYNTCGGYHYGKAEARYRGTSRPAAGETPGQPGRAEPRGPYEDLDAFLHRAGELALDLLSQGIPAMKIWPFDDVARANEGQHISARELRNCLEPFEKIRASAGDSMDIMVELHGLWEATAAIKICRALADYSPYWVEDAIKLDSEDALARLRDGTDVQFAFGETLAGIHAYKRLFDSGAADVVMYDFGWGGGISESRRVAALAEAYGLPIAPHDCVGPVALAVGAHFSVATKNVFIQETVRAYYTDWYLEIVSGLPTIDRGQIAPPPAPGIGTGLRAEFLARPDVHVRVSR
ncbi:MAG TPA: mandelate racemase/muconate lactonizing enzyme family protein [Acidimicrobiales bacterium]|nr:mandelate racemase/muconate lactonizing enzyme family protein [Acidimicrobiales bacterium]